MIVDVAFECVLFNLNALRDIFKLAPIDRLLLETDSPYLAPPPFRGKRNEPSYTTHTAKVGAEIFNMTYDEILLN